MTSTESVTAAGADASANEGVFRTELIETVRLAAPMALTQLGQVAMMTTDMILLGRLGDKVVAATALAHTVLFAAFTIGMGLVAAVAPLASQAFGAREPRMVRRALRVGLWAAVLAGIPLTAIQLYGEDILLALGQTPEAAALAHRYLSGLGWCLVPAWAFMALRNFMSAVNRPEPALWITLAAIPTNGVLAYALIYGAFGLPQLDLLGAGLGGLDSRRDACLMQRDEALLVEGQVVVELARLPWNPGVRILIRLSCGLERCHRDLVTHDVIGMWVSTVFVVRSDHVRPKRAHQCHQWFRGLVDGDAGKCVVW
jgi:hypothetical protein